MNINAYESDNVYQNKHLSWMFSQNIDISILGTTNIVVREKENLFNKKFFKLDIINQHGVFFILVSEYPENYGPYMIKNSLENVSIFYKQKTLKQKHEFPYERLQSKSETIYTWDYTLEDKVLLVEFDSPNYEKLKYPLQLSTLNNINETYQYILLPKQINQPPLLILTRIKLFKEMKIIEFINGENLPIQEDIEVIKEKNINEEVTVSIKMILKMKYVGISFIQNSSHPFNELMFICFKGFEFIILDKHKTRTYQIRLKNFVINNNSSDLVRFPVVISSSEKNIDENPNKFLINLMLKKHLESKEVKFLINSLIKTFRLKYMILSDLIWIH